MGIDETEGILRRFNEGRIEHTRNVCLRIAKWLLRNKDHPEVFPKTLGSFASATKKMNSISYLQCGQILDTLTLFQERKVFVIDQSTGNITYKKKKKIEEGEGKKSVERKSEGSEGSEEEEKESEEEEEEEEEEVEYHKMTEEERALAEDIEWITHPHNSPKHMKKLIHSLAFRSQIKLTSRIEDVITLLVKDGLVSLALRKGEEQDLGEEKILDDASRHTGVKINFHIKLWERMVSTYSLSFMFHDQCERLEEELESVYWFVPPSKTELGSRGDRDGRGGRGDRGGRGVRGAPSGGRGAYVRGGRGAPSGGRGAYVRGGRGAPSGGFARGGFARGGRGAPSGGRGAYVRGGRGGSGGRGARGRGRY